MSVKDAMTYKKNCPLCGGIVYVKSAVTDGLSAESARAPLYAKWQCQNCGAEFEAKLNENLRPEHTEASFEYESPGMPVLGDPGNFIIG